MFLLRVSGYYKSPSSIEAIFRAYNRQCKSGFTGILTELIVVDKLILIRSRQMTRNQKSLNWKNVFGDLLSMMKVRRVRQSVLSVALFMGKIIQCGFSVIHVVYGMIWSVLMLTTTIFLRHLAVKFVVSFILLPSPPNFCHAFLYVINVSLIILNLCILVILQ